MRSLTNKIARGNTAWAMLLVCFFTLTSGLANACLMEPRGVHDHGSPPSHRAPGVAALRVTGHHAEDRHDDGDSDTGSTKESCLKACDESSQSLLKHASSVDLVDPGPAPFVVAAWASQVNVAPALGLAHDFRLPARGPPVRVLFSRLAI